MKRRVLAYLACPECRSSALTLETFRDTGEEVLEGALRCECGRTFPVIAGIPRMLPDALRGNVVRYHQGYFERHPSIGDELPPATAEDDAGSGNRELDRTLRFYSFLHPRLRARITPGLRRFWASSFALRIQADPGFFAGKLGLDGGCGEGRYSWHVAGLGAEIIALDLSEGVNVAYRNAAGSDAIHVVQGSLYQLPIRAEVLDFVFSTGVLHHLPDPRRGFQSLVPALKPGGRIMVWVYGLRKMNLTYRLSHLTALRGLGPRLGPLPGFAVSAWLATILDITIYGPARVAAAVGGERRLPRQLLEVARLPFIWKVKEVQDRIGVPVTYYITEDELQDWYGSEGLENVEIVNTNGRGWYGSGWRR